MMLRFNPVTGEIELAPASSQRPGPEGSPGTPGKHGRNGTDGCDGKDGVDGRDGKDGVDGRDGKDGADGRNGRNGSNGNTIRYGHQPPQSSDGTPGDLYIDLSQWTIYGPMGPDLSWPIGTSLIGPQGPRGSDGEPGKPGKDGKDGRPGERGEKGLQGERGSTGLTDPESKLHQLALAVVNEAGTQGNFRTPVTLKVN